MIFISSTSSVQSVRIKLQFLTVLIAVQTKEKEFAIYIKFLQLFCKKLCGFIILWREEVVTWA